MGIREEAFYLAVKVYFTSTFLVKVEVIVIHISYFVLVSMLLTFNIRPKSGVNLASWKFR